MTVYTSEEFAEQGSQSKPERPVEDVEQLEPELPVAVNLITLEKCMSDYSSDELDDIGEEFGPSISQSHISTIKQASPMSKAKAEGVVRSITQKL